jgi:hypothetical protein
MNDAGTLVDVAAFEREPLLGPRAGEHYEHRQTAALGGELLAYCLELGDGREGENLAPLRLRVRHLSRHLLVVRFSTDVATVDQYAALKGVSASKLTGREARWQGDRKADFVGPRFPATWGGSEEEKEAAAGVAAYVRQT